MLGVNHIKVGIKYYLPWFHLSLLHL